MPAQEFEPELQPAVLQAYEQIVARNTPPAFLLQGLKIIRVLGDLSGLFPGVSAVNFTNVQQLPDGTVKCCLLTTIEKLDESESTFSQIIENYRVTTIPWSDDSLCKLALVVFERNESAERTVPIPNAIAPSTDSIESEIQKLRNVDFQKVEFVVSNAAMVWETDADGLATYISETELAYAGCTSKQQLGAGWADGIHPDDADASLAIYRGALQRREPFEFVCRRRRFDGEYFWFKSHGVPQFDVSKQFVGYKGFCLEITQQLETRTALSNSQRVMRSILDNSPFLVAFVDRDLNYQYVNSKYAEFWGSPRDEIAGTHASKLTGEFYESLIPFFDRALKGETVVHEMVVPGSNEDDGKWLDITHVPALDANDSVEGFCCFVNDVTESRKREKLLQLVQDQVPALMVLLSPEFEIRYANCHFLETLSVLNSEVVGAKLPKIVGEETFLRFHGHLQQALAGEKCSFESRLPLPDGRIQDVLVNLVPELDASQTVIGICGMISDVTQLKKTQTELERSEARVDLAVSGSSVGIFEFDQDRPDWIFADHIERLLGFDRGELKNSRRMVRSLIHPDELEKNDAARRLADAGEDQKLVHRLKTKLNEYRWFEIASRSNIDADGKPQKWAGTITDINDLKIAQLDLADQVKRRDQFLAMLSHELRNPMAAITFSLDFIDETGASSAELKNVVQIMKRQSAQIARLLDDLLDVSRVTHNRIEFKKFVHNLNPTVRETVESLLPNAKAKQQTVHLELTEENLVVEGDGLRLKQVISNLVDNSIRYTPVHGEIWITTRIVDGQAMFTVRDTGVGIAKDSIGRIFELFFQGNQTIQRTSGGMGVGLFMVRHIVNAHGGMVLAKSQGQDRGSQFDVVLPLSIGGRPQKPIPALQQSFDSLQVVLVEDNNDSRQMISRLLANRGFRVTQYSDGETASIEIPKLKPDVAIIDIGLPGKNGLTLALEFRKDDSLKNTLLVALTGYGQTTDRDLVSKVGYDLHLVKPANIDDLCNAIADRMRV